MTKYVTIDSFTDKEDENVHYPTGALYPREGYFPSAERVSALATSNNARGVPLIRKLIELPAKGQKDESQSEQTTLSREDIKARLDAAGIGYAKNAKTETLLEILEASKLGE